MSLAPSLRSHPEVLRIFKEHAREMCMRVDRGFAILMSIQWVAAIMAAWLVFPNTALSQYFKLEYTLLLALVCGGLIAIPAIFCVLVKPGERWTRIVVAISQVCFSILLIHLTGGRIETHFHVLLSLAFLAFYKDPLVLGIASALVIADHIFRGCVLPMSIYGEFANVQYRFIEHSIWIIFEDIVLVTGITYLREDLLDMAISKYQLIQAREEALRASSLKSIFLSNMSHEIRTPLNSIMGFTEILSETHLDDEQKKYLGTIHRCSDSLMRILNDILDLSKIENGLLQIDRHRFDMRELHKDLHRMFEIQCREKGIKLNLEVHQEVPNYVMGDSHRIRQVLMNLVGNAVKFTQEGHVSIAVEHHENEPFMRWSVVDTGVGIAPESQAKLFRPFVQADASVSRKFGGSGLGLLISKNLVELMGGEMQLVSRLGEGTTFSFTLPLEKA